MKKRVLVSSIVAAVLLSGLIGSVTQNQPQSSNSNTTTNSVTNETPEKIKPTCDGTTVTSNCIVEGINYTTYIYHPAITEESHTETITTYKQEVTGYCTLCNDGTYSPSCATGRGTCSHHDGVAQWNAPQYSNVPVYTTNKVIDIPAQEPYFEKITSNN